MKKTMNCLLCLLLLSAFLISGCGGSSSSPSRFSPTPTPTPTPTPNLDFYGIPYKLTVHEVDKNEVNVNFGIISDTHVDIPTSQEAPTNYARRSYTIIDNTNNDCRDNKCLGVVHIGDMVNANNTQYLVAFRQMFENDYPGANGGTIAGSSDSDYEAYSKGHRISLPVFPTMGNHDDPPFGTGVKDWYRARDYLNDRLLGAPGILTQYDANSYMWRWGRYVFIQLGEWAGCYEHENPADIDPNKLKWLKDSLAANVGDSNLGVFVFQHYGWDAFSTEDRWWTQAERDMELNIFCRRDNSDEPCRPYNVLGIFTGHLHSRQHIVVPVGLDPDGNQVNFDNFVVSDAGPDSFSQMGHTIVNLNGTVMDVNSKNDYTGEWFKESKSINIVGNEPNFRSRVPIRR
ncbi:MAG: metallophosphoesterase [bacterium]